VVYSLLLYIELKGEIEMPLNRDERLKLWAHRIIRPHLNAEWVDETGEISIEGHKGADIKVCVSLLLIGHNNLVLASNDPKRVLIQNAFINLN